MTWAELHPSISGDRASAKPSVEPVSSDRWPLPHPGDVLYWLLCLAGFSLLLLAAI